MRRSLLTRLDRLERARAPHGGPILIVSSVQLPDEPLTAETCTHWVTKGLARHYGGTKHIIFYDGGKQLPMAVGEWQMRYGKRA